MMDGVIDDTSGQMPIIEDNSGQVPMVAKGVRMQIIEGQIYANTIEVSDGSSSFQITLDPSQQGYSAATEQLILQNPGPEQVVIENVEADDGTGMDADVSSEKIAEELQHLKQEDDNDIASYLVSDPLSHSISHHDYTGTIPQILKQEEVGGAGGMEEALQQGEGAGGVASGGGLVIEEAVEQEISTSQSLEDEEIIRSKPLTAMYLQRKEVTNSDTVYHPHELQIQSPTKSPGSSKFTLKPSGRDFNYGDLDDLGRMRLSYNDPISVYHPNTGELQFTMDTEAAEADSRRSVQAILAASEAIKHQDVASEVEIGCEVEVSPPKKGRKRKEKEKRGIDDDIEQIRKAAKNVAYTLKGMKDEKDGRKKRRPRIRLTLTKAKSRRSTTTISDDELDYESSSYEETGTKTRKGGSERYPNVIYQCEYCDKQFKTRAKVQSHTKIHTEERAFKCDICGSEYRRREHLIRHYRRHTNERPYACLECGKSYMRAEHLKRHSYDHTGEKPFECPVCEKAFTRHDRLIKHSLVHDK